MKIDLLSEEHEKSISGVESFKNRQQKLNSYRKLTDKLRSCRVKPTDFEPFKKKE